jgi:hypothetical protein
LLPAIAPAVEILGHLSVDEGGEYSHYRFLVDNRHFMYITIDAGVYDLDDMSSSMSLLPLLPPLPPGDWNLGYISNNLTDGRPVFAWTDRQVFGGVIHE